MIAHPPHFPSKILRWLWRSCVLFVKWLPQCRWSWTISMCVRLHELHVTLVRFSISYGFHSLSKYTSMAAIDLHSWPLTAFGVGLGAGWKGCTLIRVCSSNCMRNVVMFSSSLNVDIYCNRCKWSALILCVLNQSNNVFCPRSQEVYFHVNLQPMCCCVWPIILVCFTALFVVWWMTQTISLNHGNQAVCSCCFALVFELLIVLHSMWCRIINGTCVRCIDLTLTLHVQQVRLCDGTLD